MLKASKLLCVILGLALACQVYSPDVLASPTRSAARTIHVTLRDNNHKYHLREGDSVDVQLSGPFSDFTWTEPSSSDPTVLAIQSGSSGSTGSGVFLATGTGKAIVSAVGLSPGSGYPFNIKVTVKP